MSSSERKNKLYSPYSTLTYLITFIFTGQLNTIIFPRLVQKLDRVVMEMVKGWDNGRHNSKRLILCKGIIT
jgi:hypothetical protein